MFAICVCTYKRPVMLQACLRSLIGQGAPVIVIDNDPEPHPDHEIPAGLDARIIHEPHRGISHARNAALDAATALGVEWMAFIDDDETANSPAWFVTLYIAALNYQANAVYAPVNRRYPEKMPVWMRKKTKRRKIRFPEGSHRPVAETNNVLFNLEFAVKHGLRFNPDLGLTGGEDWEFFKLFSEAGGKIVWTNHERAIVTETVPMERILFRGQIKEAFNRGFCDIRDARLLGKGVPRYTFKAIKRFIAGTVKIVFAPLMLLGGWNRFMRAILLGCRNIAQAAGTAFALSGKRFNFYKITTGF